MDGIGGSGCILLYYLRKQLVFVGTVSDMYTHRYIASVSEKGMPSQGLITSPGFPASYPHNDSAVITYLIQGISDEECVMLVFDDFDLDPASGELRVNKV